MDAPGREPGLRSICGVEGPVGLKTLRPLSIVMLLIVSGCTSVGLGGSGDAPTLTAANNRPLPDAPNTGFFAHLDSEAGAAAYAAQKEALNAPSGGTAVPWQAGGVSGTVTPGPIHTVNQRSCRDVVHVTERDMERVKGRSTLCLTRNGDETWLAKMIAVEFESIYAVSHPGRAKLHRFGVFGGSNGYWRTGLLHETRMTRQPPPFRQNAD